MKHMSVLHFMFSGHSGKWNRHLNSQMCWVTRSYAGGLQRKTVSLGRRSKSKWRPGGLRTLQRSPGLISCIFFSMVLMWVFDLTVTRWDEPSVFAESFVSCGLELQCEKSASSHVKGEVQAQGWGSQGCNLVGEVGVDAMVMIPWCAYVSFAFNTSFPVYTSEHQLWNCELARSLTEICTKVWTSSVSSSKREKQVQ